MLAVWSCGQGHGASRAEDLDGNRAMMRRRLPSRQSCFTDIKDIHTRKAA